VIPADGERWRGVLDVLRVRAHVTRAHTVTVRRTRRDVLRRSSAVATHLHGPREQCGADSARWVQELVLWVLVVWLQ
jgi:hypothetical protein